MLSLLTLSYCLAAETIILAFQNYIMMLGTSVMIPTILVPAMGGSDVSLFFLINYLYFRQHFVLILPHANV